MNSLLFVVSLFIINALRVFIIPVHGSFVSLSSRECRRAPCATRISCSTLQERCIYVIYAASRLVSGQIARSRNAWGGGGGGGDVNNGREPCCSSTRLGPVGCSRMHVLINCLHKSRLKFRAAIHHSNCSRLSVALEHLRSVTSPCILDMIVKSMHACLHVRKFISLISRAINSLCFFYIR